MGIPLTAVVDERDSFCDLIDSIHDLLIGDKAYLFLKEELLTLTALFVNCFLIP